MECEQFMSMYEDKEMLTFGCYFVVWGYFTGDGFPGQEEKDPLHVSSRGRNGM